MHTSFKKTFGLILAMATLAGSRAWAWAPNATNDSYSTIVNTTLTIAAPGVLANDADPDGQSLTAVKQSNPSHGTVTLNANGSFTYVPATNYVGADSFTYKAYDGGKYSSVATVIITVNPAPIVITVPPTNQTVCPGATVVFSITATGTNLTYQWFKATNTLTGKTNSSLTLTNVGGSDAATYSVRVSRAGNSVTNSATLTVRVPVSATPLNNAIRAVGGYVIFSTTASGTGPFSYAWRRNGTVINGQTGSSLTLTNLQTTNSATYSVVVSGPCNSVTNSATLIVDACFASVDVMLVIDRSGSMTGKPYDDARLACTNFVNNLRFTNNGDFAGLASYNDAATLNQPLTNSSGALKQAINGLPAAGGYTSISLGLQMAQAELASARHRMQALPVLVLLSDGLPTGSDSMSTALYNAKLAKDAGTRVFTVGLGGVDHALMSGMASSTNDYFYTTNSAQLTALFNAISTVICRPPTNILVTGPSNTTVCAGSTATLGVTASGCDSYSYQWRKDGVNLSGQTNSSLVIPHAAVTNAGLYAVVVSSACQTVTNSATLTVNQNTIVTTPPTDQVVCVNGNAQFTVTASGTALTYQWYRSTTALTGQISNTLTLANVSQADAGTYRVVVSGICGSPVTNSASLTVNSNVAIVTAPTNQTSVIGGSATFSVVATGTGLAYAWTFNGVVVGTGSTLTLNNITTGQAGTYCVAVSGVCGGPATNCAVLTLQNRAPVANNDAYTMAEDTALVIAAPGILANDIDLDGNPLSAVFVSNPAHGVLTLSANGSFNYLPATNYTGTDSFTYKASDGTATSGAATVTITITNVNDAPVANNDAYTMAEDTLLTIAVPGVLANDVDVDGNPLSAALASNPAHGVVTLNANGSFNYLPATNYNGLDTFTYRATDGIATSAVATVTITITNVNDAPVAVDDAYTMAEDTLLTISAPGVLGNDLDVDGNPLSAVFVANPSHGSLTLNPNGSFSYQPATNYTGVDSFTYKASDGVATSGVATVTITITNVNDAPVANNDAYTMAEDTLLIIAVPGVLINDVDVDGDPLSAVLVGDPAHGVVTLNANGSFNYRPATNYTGSDVFTYKANDGSATSGVATVTITITNVNDAPVANNDAYTMAEDTLLTVAAPGVLGNDLDVDGDPLSAVFVTNPAHGALTLNANGSISYLPATNYTGLDTFTYKATDGTATSGVATVTITITNVNDAPVAINDAYTMAEDTLLTIAAPGVLGNDSDADGDVLSAVIVGNPAHGVLTLNPNGSFNYLPATNFAGIDSFTYKATDGVATSGVATVTITITNINDAPVAMDDAYTMAEDTLLTVDLPGVLGNDSDADGNQLSAVLVSSPHHGVLLLNAAGSFTYQPDTNYHGLDSFTYRATDGFATSDVATVTLTITNMNDTPVAVNDAYTMAEDTLLIIPAAGVLTNDLDADGDVLGALLASQPAHGAVTLNSNGSFNYRPATNYTGLDNFTYRATDGTATSDVATVTITITNINDAPVAVDDAYTMAEDTLLSVTAPGVLTNDIDVDGDGLSAVFVTNPAHGTLTLNANGSFNYRPATNYNGLDTFTYRATDGIATSGVATVMITITNINDTPVAMNDAYSTVEDTVLNVPAPGVLGNDLDADGDALSAVLVSNPAHGALILNANGSFTYRPATNYAGLDTFTYRATDGSATSDVATVTITVTPVNDAPVASDDAYTMLEDTVLTMAAPGVMANDLDVDGNAIKSILVGNPVHGVVTLSTNGSFVYMPATNYNGTDSFTYKVSDGLLESGVATVTINITPVNDPPVVSIVNPTDGSTFLSPAHFTVVADAADLDGVVTNVQVFRGTNLIGTFTNAPYFVALTNLGFGTYTFYATATDDGGLRATSSVVSVTVTTTPPVTALGPIVLNRQNGLFEQFVRISNPTPDDFPNGMRLFVDLGIDTTNKVWNATGTNAMGVRYIDTPTPLPSGGHLDVLVQYYVPNARTIPNAVVTAQPLPFVPPPAPRPQIIKITTTLSGATVNFTTVDHGLYFLQCSEDLVLWTTIPGLMHGTGGGVQCHDPAPSAKRFYRVIKLP